ncbi:DUF2273 domain-containing protein [Bombilactobacillus folatiphilus]|uniref:DUF2273 domain-containing protein n=1 Tax=Bombilactobacillus folatiphilus TaxID=2923362 RepID=A0ABY4P8X7_9LACO|nr:DUF2273 domain-containing protein [Bombilactobacillus folatiphilus]UQS82072.1 DUF2273 domain-containing protein [Bombilactobacillus folatiphilus]
MKTWLNQNSPEIIGILGGFILGLLFLAFGFFQTVFLIILMILGGVIGHYLPLLNQLHNKKE